MYVWVWTKKEDFSREKTEEKTEEKTIKTYVEDWTIVLDC